MLASNKWMCICWSRTVLNTPTSSQKNPKAAYLTEGLSQPPAQHIICTVLLRPLITGFSLTQFIAFN